MQEVSGIEILKEDQEKSLYDESYFEHGLESGRSLYQNYRWIPELTIPMAMTIIDFLRIKRGQTILDFGCAKGYLVKALRLLYRDAYGVDVSEYAIENADPVAKDFCSLKKEHWKRTRQLGFPSRYDYCIAKDVFEHIDKQELKTELANIPAEVLFAVIPLGEGGSYIAGVNDWDITHKICETGEWWVDFFSHTMWNVQDFRLCIPGIKDQYYEQNPESHGFFTLRRR